MSATLHMVLGGVLAVLFAVVCSLLAGPERGGSQAGSSSLSSSLALQLLTFERVASMPLQALGQNECALESEVVDVDDDDTDEESKLGHDDAPPVDVPQALAFRNAVAARAPRSLRSAPASEPSRFAVGTRLARGPPVVGEAASV